MTIEIWSDVMCPFCYLGKRKFENALTQFAEKDSVNVIWKSFLLNPDLKTDTSISIYEYLSKAKGIGIEQAKEMNKHITQSGKLVDVEYNFDKVIVANTFKAHILLHCANNQGKQNEVKERLLKAFFTEGRNVDDISVLLEIGNEAGLKTDTLAEALDNESYIDEVREDIYEAQQFGIRGVPFFVFDRKYGVSGAQETPVFLETLKKSFAEWRKMNPEIHMEIIHGESCDIDGTCG